MPGHPQIGGKELNFEAGREVDFPSNVYALLGKTAP